MSEMDRVLIVGVNGKFGQVFAHRLSQMGYPIAGIDLQNEAVASSVRDYLQSDLTNPEDRELKLLRESRIILLCVPESVTMHCLNTVLTHVPDDALIMDIASVKSHIAELVTSSSYQGEYLSVHPMFGPTADFAGRNLAVITVCAESKSEVALQWFRDWGVSIIELTAEEHDRATAWLQAGAHAMLLAWAKSASLTGIAPEKLFELGTPVSLGLSAWLVRMHDAGADLYFDLQQANPYASEMRQNLGQNLAQVDELLQTGDREQFRGTFDAIQSTMETAELQLRELASGMVRALKAEMDHE